VGNEPISDIATWFQARGFELTVEHVAGEWWASVRRIDNPGSVIYRYERGDSAEATAVRARERYEQYSDYERYKWETLAHLFHRFGIDGAWAEVRRLEPENVGAQHALVRRVIVDLLDDGLIFGAFASRDDAYQLKPHEFVRVPRESVEAELARPVDYVEPEERRLWLIPTDEAEEVWQSLPPEAYLDPRSARKQGE
jgi:hypothetical protein